MASYTKSCSDAVSAAEAAEVVSVLPEEELEQAENAEIVITPAAIILIVLRNALTFMIISPFMQAAMQLCAKNIKFFSPQPLLFSCCFTYRLFDYLISLVAVAFGYDKGRYHSDNS